MTLDNFTIFNMQTIAGLLTFYFAFKWFVFPKLAKLSIYDALVPNRYLFTDFGI